MVEPSLLMWKDIITVADKVCAKFGLSYAKIEPETKNRAHWYGETAGCEACRCKPSSKIAKCTRKIIRIRVHRVYRPNKPLSSKVLWDTLAHELAHLRPDCWPHGRKHKAFQREILAYIKTYLKSSGSSYDI